MLDDRDYMRQPSYRTPRISYTVALLGVCAVVFLIECIFCGYPPRFYEDNYFALSLYGLKHGYVWQLLTYQFMHAGLLHIFFNGMVIYFFGRFVEERYGGKAFLTLFLTSGVVGGLVQMLTAFVWPAHFGGAVIGASGGAIGLVAAFAVANWREPFTLFIYFIPVTMCGRTLFWGSIGFTIIFGLIPNTGIANAAHLGGILTGYFYARQIIEGRWHLPQWKFPTHRAARREYAAARAGKSDVWRSADKPEEDLSANEFLQREVDPILDKISAHGIHSLTAREREILEKARTKMTRR
jgi:rhomboid family protein